jgi:hypothetical protein
MAQINLGLENCTCDPKAKASYSNQCKERKRLWELMDKLVNYTGWDAVETQEAKAAYHAHLKAAGFPAFQGKSAV